MLARVPSFTDESVGLRVLAKASRPIFSETFRSPSERDLTQSLADLTLDVPFPQCKLVSLNHILAKKVY